MGIPFDSLVRACAGLNHVLLEATGEGHCALPTEMLREETCKLLLVDDTIVGTALERTLAAGDLVQEAIDGQELIFMPYLKRAEEGIAAGSDTCALHRPVTRPSISRRQWSGASTRPARNWRPASGRRYSMR